MQDRLVLLGTKGGPAIRTRGPSPSANLLVLAGRAYVVDCGLGVARGLVDVGFDLKALRTVLITHHHSDHNLDWGNLINTAWMAGLAHPVRTYAPPPIRAMREAYLALNAFDLAIRVEDEGRPDPAALFEVEEYTEGLVFDDGAVRVTALRVPHPPIRDCFALKFEGAGRTIVFSADTAYHPPLAEFARGADILVHEGMYGPGVDALVARVANGARLKEHLLASHTLAEDVGRIATAAEVGHLVVNHLVPADDPAVTPAHWQAAIRTTWSGALTIARDGLSIPLDRSS